MVEDNLSLKSPKLHLTIQLENDIWQLQFLFPEVELKFMFSELQLQLNLTAWVSWWILQLADNRQGIKKEFQGGMKWRKKNQEVQTLSHAFLTLGLDKFIKFLYGLDEPLGKVTLLWSDSDFI
jgi:hypothetical protein